MKNCKKLIVSAVALTTALLSTLSLGVGVTQGRINNTVSEKIVYESKTSDLQSNYLKKGGQTVLLENWTVGSAEAQTQTITLASAEAVNGTISCSSSSQYVSAELDKSNITINGEESVKLSLKLNSSASEITERTEVTVYVSFSPNNESEAIWANFSFELCPENEIVTDVSVGLSSNYLVSGGRIVLLDDWVVTSNTSRVKDIKLETYAGEISGELVCASDSDYVTATIGDSAGAQSVTVVHSSTTVSSFKLVMTDKASEITEETLATIRVCWIPESATDGKATMWADFVVKLVPEAKTVSAEESGEQLSVADWQDSFDWNSKLQIPVTCPVGTTKIAFEYNGEAFPEKTKYSTDNNTYYTLGESINISVDCSNGGGITLWLDFSEVGYTNANSVKISATAYSKESVLASADKTILITYTAQDDQTIFAENSYLKEICKEDIVLLEMHIPKGSESMIISYNNGDFPDGVRYSIDSENYVFVKKSDEIVLPVSEETEVNLFIDLSHVDESKITDEIILTASAYVGVVEKQSESITVKTTLAPLSVSYDISQMYIGYNGAIVLAASGENAEFVVEKLEKSGYTTSDDNFGVIVGIVDGELVISNADEKAAAGAYKLSMIRKQNGYELSSIEIPFFIHY